VEYINEGYLLYEKGTVIFSKNSFIFFLKLTGVQGYSFQYKGKLK